PLQLRWKCAPQNLASVAPRARSFLAKYSESPHSRTGCAGHVLTLTAPIQGRARRLDDPHGRAYTPDVAPLNGLLTGPPPGAQEEPDQWSGRHLAGDRRGRAS